jgi:hypothetical protein
MAGTGPIMDRCVDCQRLGVYDHSLRSESTRRKHDHYIASFAAMPAGVERLVRVVHYLAGVSAGRAVPNGPLRFEPILGEFYPDLTTACPDYWPGGPSTVNLLMPPWNPLEVSAWFLPRVALTGRPPNAELKGWLVTGNWVHGWRSAVGPPLAAWRLTGGSLSSLTPPGAVGDDGRADAYVVVADGRVMLDYEQPCLLSARGLVGMGMLLWGQPRRPWDAD